MCQYVSGMRYATTFATREVMERPRVRRLRESDKTVQIIALCLTNMQTQFSDGVSIERMCLNVVASKSPGAGYSRLENAHRNTGA